MAELLLITAAEDSFLLLFLWFCVIDWAINTIKYTWPTSIHFFFTSSQAFKVTSTGHTWLSEQESERERVLLALADVAFHTSMWRRASLSTNVRISSMENNQKVTSRRAGSDFFWITVSKWNQSFANWMKHPTHQPPPPSHTQNSFPGRTMLYVRITWRIETER